RELVVALQRDHLAAHQVAHPRCGTHRLDPPAAERSTPRASATAGRSSAAGRGALDRVRMPQSAAFRPTRAAREPPRGPPVGTRDALERVMSHPSSSVLIVDDDAAMRQMLASLLRERGLGAAEAASADAAIERLREAEYGAVLS